MKICIWFKPNSLMTLWCKLYMSTISNSWPKLSDTQEFMNDMGNVWGFHHSGAFDSNYFHFVMKIRWVSVVEFHDRALSIGKVFGQESTVVKWNYQILSLHLVTVRQKVPILDFQSEFSMSKIIRIFLKKFHWRISIKAHLFCKKHFLLTSIFKPLYY